MQTIYKVQDSEGNWHEISGFQYAALKADGVTALRTREAETK